MVAKKSDKQKVTYTEEEYDALKAENLKFQKRILQLEAQVISAANGFIAGIDGKPLRELTANELRSLIERGIQREKKLLEGKKS